MTSHSARIFLSLGSNLGNRQEWLDEALWLLEGRGIGVVHRSSWYETEPVGTVPQADFLNIACEVRTHLAPRPLLDCCLETERELGRRRTGVKGPRNIDIDILYYGDRIVREPALSLPHPAAHLRRFVLVPLAEIAAEFRDPVTGHSIEWLLRHCPDPAAVRRWDASVPAKSQVPVGSKSRRGGE